MDTSSWERNTFELRTEIRLDPQNVRLELANAQVEADIIEDLFANEDALGLVEGICAVGYLTHETPIVIKRSGKNVVVEGNRRVAALKAMQNPMLVPDFSNRISALLQRYPDHPKITKVEALIAPSQDAADQLIAAIHTGNLRRAWTPARQAAFFQAQIDGGRTYQQLVARYPTSDVKKFVFRAQMVNRFKSANYSSPELKDFVRSAKFKKGLSTLARIYDSKEYRELTGLKVSDDGGFTVTVNETEFDAIATVIVQGMKENSLNTRTLNKVKQNPRFTQLMHDLTDTLNSARGERTTKINAGDKTPSNEPKTTTDRPKRKSREKYLNVSRIAIPDNYGEGFKQIVGELSDTDVQKRPATAFLLMRAALEKGIKSYAEVQGAEIKKSKNNHGYVYLKHCLEWLSEHAKKSDDKWVPQVISNMNKLVYYTISSDKLNAVNHNHKFYVTSEEAINMWRTVVSLLEYVIKP